MSPHRFMIELEISGFTTDNPEKVERYYKRYLDGIQTKIWYSNKIVVLRQNYGFQTKLWYSDEIMIFKQNYGTMVFD